MKEIPREEILTLLASYVDGKDNDRPEILRKIYATDARVLFDIRTPNINFPPEIRTSESIAEILSAEFNRRFSSPRTYYLAHVPGRSRENRVKDLPWLVIMRDRATGAVNVGWGLYDWFFGYSPEGPSGAWRIRRHDICIWEMITVEERGAPILEHLQNSLSYPWPEPDQVREHLGNREEFKGIEQLYRLRD